MEGFGFGWGQVGGVGAVHRFGGSDPGVAGGSQLADGVQSDEEFVDGLVVTGFGFGPTRGQQPDLSFVQPPCCGRRGAVGHVLEVAGLA